MIATDRRGAGEPLVLLHGVGANRTVWRRVAPLLARERLVLAPDLPGFGDSAPVSAGFDLEVVATALADALAEHAPCGFDLLGNSLGGAVALTLATLRPVLVRRLLLVAPAGFAPLPSLPAHGLGKLAPPMLALRRILGAQLVPSSSVRRALLWGVIAEPQRLSAPAARTLLEGSRGSTRIGEAVTAVLQADLRSALERLESPLGLIWGECDRIVPLRTLELMRALRPDAVVETIAAAAHVPQLERPEQFVTSVDRVLGLLPQSPPDHISVRGRP